MDMNTIGGVIYHNRQAYEYLCGVTLLLLLLLLQPLLLEEHLLLLSPGLTAFSIQLPFRKTYPWMGSVGGATMPISVSYP